MKTGKRKFISLRDCYVLDPTMYRKVVTSRLSWLIAHLRIFRPFMKGKLEDILTKCIWPIDFSSERVERREKKSMVSYENITDFL